MDLAHLILEYLKVFVWPVTVAVLCFSFRRQLIEVANRLRHADLPGGISVDLQEVVHQTHELSNKVQAAPPPEGEKRMPSIPLTEANTRMIHLSLRPSPSGLDMSYYRVLARQDPNVALAGLRIELDILARNLAKGFGVETNERDSGTHLLRKLHEQGAITSDQMQLAIKILSVCNAAVHGNPISLQEAVTIIDSAEVLADQYLSWLSWGFPDGWKRSESEEPA